MGQRRISRLRGAALVAALAVVSVACSNDNNNSGGASNQPPSFNNTVLSIALATDGSGDVYVGGDFTNYNGTAANDLVRLNANGLLDLVFATRTGFSNTVFSVVLVGDGSGDVYVGGQFTQYQFTPIGRFTRLKSTGAFVR